MSNQVLTSIYKDIVKSTFFDLLEKHRHATLQNRDAELNIAAGQGVYSLDAPEAFSNEAFVRCIIAEVTRWADYDIPLDEEEISLWSGLDALAQWYSGNDSSVGEWHIYAGEPEKRHALLKDIKEFVHQWLDNLEDIPDYEQVLQA